MVMVSFALSNVPLRDRSLLCPPSPRQVTAEHRTSVFFLVVFFLQGVRQKLVHLGNLGRYGEIDRSVANFNNQSSFDIGVNLEIVSTPIHIRKECCQRGLPRL